MECSGIEALKYTLENESHDFFLIEEEEVFLKVLFFSLTFSLSFPSEILFLGHRLVSFCQTVLSGDFKVTETFIGREHFVVYTRQSINCLALYKSTFCCSLFFPVEN